MLELAAGTGETGYEAARLLGPEGRLITSDFSPQMVEAARRRADELGVANAEFRVIDAERIELPDGSVDAVLCRYGYMLMADPARALRETHRVLRPGGRLALAVFTEPERNPWGLFGRVLVERAAMPAPHPGAPGIFALADRARVAEPVAGAGFAAPEIEEIEPVAPFREAGGRLVFPGLRSQRRRVQVSARALSGPFARNAR